MYHNVLMAEMTFDALVLWLSQLARLTFQDRYDILLRVRLSIVVMQIYLKNHYYLDGRKK